MNELRSNREHYGAVTSIHNIFVIPHEGRTKGGCRVVRFIARPLRRVYNLTMIAVRFLMRLIPPCALLLLAAIPAYAATQKKFDPTTCHLTALVTNDNDIRLEDSGDDRPPGKAVSMPEPVAHQIRASATKFLAKLDPELTEELTCKEVFQATYRISEPQHRELYVADIEASVAGGFFYLFLFDPSTGSVTQNPPRIFAKWTASWGGKDEIMKAPFVSSADLFSNHEPQIVFEERAHNGTMYNAVIYHYFNVGPHLELTRVLARETRLIADPLRGVYVRKLTSLSPGRLKLEMFYVPDADAMKREEIGYAILESPGPNSPFHVAERKLNNPKYLHCLITCMDMPPADDIFLREGNTFYY